MIKKDETINNTIVTYEPIKYKDHDYLRVQGLCVNEEFLKDMNYKFISGGVGDFQRKSNEFPIILGSSYREKYKVLDTIYSIDLIADSNIQEIKMKVVGILDSGNYVYENGIMAEGKLLDNTIIYPFNDGVLKKERKDERIEGIVKSSLVNHISAGYLVTQNREYINEISNELLEYKYKFKLVDLNDSIKEYKNEIKDSLSPVIVTSIIVILFSLISVIIVMINSISKDKREYGINIMVGATLKDIKFRVIGELYVLLSLSLIVSGVILNTIPELKFNIFDFLLASLCMIFLIALVSLILIYNLNKISIDTLMRRKE
ncbi:ABC transporter permease [Clostridium sp. LY3-2]|uniref:ABC transporter permease n=1 Tax=Clostridium sp. LY3-2 TaxID=2942482 RepID=UPI002152EF6C|nr:ABC transporter permease [Clostridium sp. LY3-2]MCR6514345.1 ABC transporter permease [Clostridium sp. LY3-2]